MVRNVSWWKILGLAILAEILMVLIAILYMVVYSYGIHPGETNRYYEEHVRIAGPYIAILAGLPVFFALSRWIAHMPSALAFWGAYVALDTVIILCTDGAAGIRRILPLWLTAHGSQLLGAWLGSLGRKR